MPELKVNGPLARKQADAQLPEQKPAPAAQPSPVNTADTSGRYYALRERELEMDRWRDSLNYSPVARYRDLKRRGGQGPAVRLSRIRLLD